MTEHSASILGFFIPARTNPLGHGFVVGMGNIRLQGFENSNQDHSGQFHGYYSEIRGSVVFRAGYWNKVLRDNRAMDKAESDLSGLRNNLEL